MSHFTEHINDLSGESTEKSEYRRDLLKIGKIYDNYINNSKKDRRTIDTFLSKAYGEMDEIRDKYRRKSK